MNRRRFFHWCSLLFGGLAAAIIAIPGTAFFVDPLSRGKRAGKRHRLLKLNDLEVGVPRKVVISDQRIDAWTRHPLGPIGAVWLVRRQDGSVAAFSSICPHLGCGVDYHPEGGKFFCPCHQASYASDGGIIAGPVLRGLDALEVRLDTVKGEAWVSVVYEKFAAGLPEKISRG